METLLLAGRPVRVLMACVAALVAVNAAVATARLADAATPGADPSAVIVEDATDGSVRIVGDDGSTRFVDPSTPEGMDAIADAETRGATVITEPPSGSVSAAGEPSVSAPAAQAADDGSGDDVQVPSVPGAPAGNAPSGGVAPPVSVTTPGVTITTPPVTVTTPRVTVTTPAVSVTTPPVSVSTPITTVTVPATTVTVPATTVTVPATTVTVPPETVTRLAPELGL